MKNERYSRQSGIGGWNQEKLRGAYVAVVGGEETSALACFVSAGLTALGIGKIFLTGRKGDAAIFGFDGKIEDYLAALNPEVKVYVNEAELSNRDIAEYILSRTLNSKLDVIIDVSNKPESQYCCLDYGKKQDIPVFIGASCSNGIIFLRSMQNGKQKDIESIVKTALDFQQSEGKLNSEILAPIIIDETRKNLMMLEEDVEARDFCYRNSDFSEYIDKNVLMVGAGAIGTYAAIGLALNGIKNLWVADFDSIEVANLASQILYYDFDKLNTRKKASVLVSRLSKIAGRYCFKECKLLSLEERIDSDFVNFLGKNKVEVIIGCVDNMYTRAVLNMFSAHQQVPYIDGGSGKFGCDVFTYIPGKTACLDCQLDGTIKDSVEKEREATRERERKGCIYEPSLIVPNEIAGAIMVNRLKRLEKEPVSVSFLSGNGLSLNSIKEKCKEGCNPYSLIAELKKIEG